MKIFLFLAAFVCLSVPLWPQEDDPSYYIKMNDEITVLEDFKDSPEMIMTKLKEVDNINKYRSALNKKIVKLDILASRVANMQCYNAAVNGYSGHFDLSGYKPYIRYSLAGGKDHVMENASSEWSTGIAREGMDDMAQALVFMKKGLDEFMSEGPGGGHYENDINGYHNYVGLGYFCTNIGDSFQVRYYEEFIDRYIKWDDFPLTAPAGGSVTVSGKVTAKDAGVYAVIVYYEKFPEKMTPAEISSRSSYNDYTSTEYLQIWPWNIDFNKETQEFKINLKLGRAGFYYVQVFLKKGISSIPYGGQGSASTVGLANASGVIIRVNQSAADRTGTDVNTANKAGAK